MTHPELTRKLSLFFALALALPGLAQAQQDFDDGADDVEEIIVTGSYIKGTPEDAPNPVSVLTREDLLDQGSPTIVELVKNIGISSGVDGETNQFQSNGQEGAANINLRGLGPGRTLVLMNGKRMSYSGVSVTQAGYQQFVNINNIPVLAIERIEMLRDGASAIYGSDAVSGVANFLTRDTFEGLEIAFNHRMVSDSDGWNEAGIVWGQNFGDNSHLLLVFGYNTRSELEVVDREWATPVYTGLASLFNGWSGLGNPSTYAGNAIAGFTQDPACTEFSGLTGSNACRFQYTQYDNIIEDEERYQLYAEWDLTFAGGSELEISALVANAEVPEWKTSPSYPPNATSRNLIYNNHPGFIQMVNDINADAYEGSRICRSSNAWQVRDEGSCPTGGPTTGDTGYRVVSGVVNQDTYTSSSAFSTAAAEPIRFGGRYLGWGAEAPQTGLRTHDNLNLTYRYSFTLGGGGIDAIIQGGYGSQTSDIIGADMMIQRFFLALSGYGGPNCVTSDSQVTDILGSATATSAGTTSGLTAGQGDCMFYNPFSNALPRAYRGVGTATSGNDNYVASVANNPALLNWLWESTPATLENTLLTTEAIFSGTFGNHGWAAGAQLRLETSDGSYGGFNDHTAYPCESEFIRDAARCGQNRDMGIVYENGVYAFLAPATPFSLSETVIAGFGEVELNLLDSLVLQVAGRFESYSEAGVSSLVPKVSVRWDVTNGLSLRGSFGQSFKAPQLAQISLSNSTSLSFVPPIGTFKAIDTSTHGDGLDPESATNVNFGLILDMGGLFLSFDVWSTDLSDPIVTESYNLVLGQVCVDNNGDEGRTLTPTPRVCDYTAPLAHRINMNGRVLSDHTADQMATPEALERIRVFLLNGDSLSTSGYDINLRYSFADWTNPMTLGFEWSHLDSYELTAPLDGTGALNTVTGVGQLNNDDPMRSLPEDKYRFYWNMDIGSLRLGASYYLVSEYLDERDKFAGLFTVGTHTVESHGTFHFNATYKLNSDKTRVFVQIDNLLDEDPPFARLNLAYDPYTHSPLGQTIKFGFLHQF